ncbi:class A sortase [uncultured Secundilactobacillus sp.]|uniref:class A sortase n=1 Tax=uncultured Secundilactobacillus sp. TaxID=2813935 RepID=UPI00258B6145|nr:class A sortase [uncultured Secundilactobacillus sp.]
MKKRLGPARKPVLGTSRSNLKGFGWWEKLKALPKWSRWLAVCLVGFGLGFSYWYFSPQHTVVRAEHGQAKMANSLKIHDGAPNGSHYQYGVGDGVPDLNALMRLRRNQQGLTLRGQVSIPKYKVNVPVFEGTSPYTLAWGAGTAKAGEEMGKRNFAIEGHNFRKLAITHNWFFSNFEKGVAPAGVISLGYIQIPLRTKVYARNTRTVYEYEIVKRDIKDIRNPTAGDVLRDEVAKEAGKPVITMSTCYEQTGILHPYQRIVLTGILKKATPTKDFKQLRAVFHGKL